ncbi:MAG TPA: hypothetical protein ENI42_05755 [Thermoplasmatales archaeon]|nr:hypothetical protein [Thermoplasmatales archaeon]
MVTLFISSHLALNRNKKPRHRYIGFIITGVEKGFDRNAVNNAIKEKTQELFGKKTKDFGLKLIRFNGKKGMIHCFHIYKTETIQILQSINKINKKNVKVKTVGTSGTIKSLNKKFFKGKLKR